MNPKILEKKQKALDHFTKNLLESEAGKSVGRIILFGSVVEGEADKYSDIDLMIFADKKAAVEDTSSRLGYDVLMDHGELVEPHVYPIKEYSDPQSYFVYRAVEVGRDLYSR